MQGRKALHTKLKIVKGTHQKCRDRDVPKLPKEKPVPPARLNKRAKLYFNLFVKRLEVFDMDFRTFTEIIAWGAEAFETSERLGKILEQQGTLYATEKIIGSGENQKIVKEVKERPEVSQRNKARADMLKFLTTCGLTPTEYYRMGPVKKSTKKKNEFEGF